MFFVALFALVTSKVHAPLRRLSDSAVKSSFVSFSQRQSKTGCSNRLWDQRKDWVGEWHSSSGVSAMRKCLDVKDCGGVTRGCRYLGLCSSLAAYKEVYAKGDYGEAEWKAYKAANYKKASCRKCFYYVCKGDDTKHKSSMLYLARKD